MAERPAVGRPAAGRPAELRVGERSFTLSHPDKVLFPGGGVTKAALVEYYRRVAKAMLPHLQGRPLMLERHPDGTSGQSFMQKTAPGYFPDWVHTARLAKQGGSVRYAVCDDEATLAYLAGQATTTFHTWLSRADRPEHPDRLIFDLDPSSSDFGQVRRAALDLRPLLESVGLVPFVQTTGSRGLHVVVPLDRSADFDRVRRFARQVGDVLAAAAPDERTGEASKAKRRDRLYIDVMRNGYGQTAVAPYSVRALPEAPVATPLEWEELDNRRLDARHYRIGMLGRRLSRRGDPWAEMDKHARPLPGAEDVDVRRAAQRPRRAG